MTKKGPILLVDDDRDECELVKEALEAAGIQNDLVCFHNGQEALDFLHTDVQPFLILTDINMPVMGGLEMRQRIGQNPELKKKSIPFLFLTTSATPHAVAQAYDLSVQGFFQKPDNFDELKTLLKAICGYWDRCRHPNN